MNENPLQKPARKPPRFGKRALYLLYPYSINEETGEFKIHRDFGRDLTSQMSIGNRLEREVEMETKLST
ncbi:unnamed protein product, partial [Oppiella nova]